MLVAGTVGVAARSIGRGARDLEPHHRRDGLGLLTLGLAIVLAGGLWMRMDNAAGHVIRQAVTGGVGSLAFLAPVLVALLAWRFLRHPDRNEATRRAVLGWIALLLGLTGLLEIAKGAPRPSDGSQVLRKAGGYIGYGTGGPLARVLTPWVGGLLLALLCIFGLLLITGHHTARHPRTPFLAARDLRPSGPRSRRRGRPGDRRGLREQAPGCGAAGRAARWPRTSGCARPWRAASGSSRTTRRCWARPRSGPTRPRRSRARRTARPA